jgi:hypothetical protein
VVGPLQRYRQVALTVSPCLCECSTSQTEPNGQNELTYSEGLTLGARVGDGEGEELGTGVGATVGGFEGRAVGDVLGEAEGAEVGMDVGGLVGPIYPGQGDVALVKQASKVQIESQRVLS